jgi:multiple sugar transport system substrate-binding protein
MIELTGIAWNHTRGYLPMVATAQRFEETYPGVSITWQRRSLQRFADCPIERLAEGFDLLVIDHPFVGYALSHDVLIPMDEHLPAEFLAEQASNCVGLSHASYNYGEHQWALAIDGATPISGWRPDLLERAGVALPRRWPELLGLASRGLVVVPAIPIDSLMHFYMLCGALGEEPFRHEERVVGRDTGARALMLLRDLLLRCPAECFERNPIATWETMSSSDCAAYCPFAYGYSNYARPGYARHALKFGGLVALDSGVQCRSTLGGAGLAISSRSKHQEPALAYAQFVASAACQRGIYFESGGQPGHCSAWLDAEVNRRSGDFFRDTLETLDHAWLRPRFDGYLRFQDAAAPVVYRYLRHGGSEKDVLASLDGLLADSRRPAAKYEGGL